MYLAVWSAGFLSIVDLQGEHLYLGIAGLVMGVGGHSGIGQGRTQQGGVIWMKLKVMQVLGTEERGGGSK